MTATSQPLFPTDPPMGDHYWIAPDRVDDHRAQQLTQHQLVTLAERLERISGALPPRAPEGLPMTIELNAVGVLEGCRVLSDAAVGGLARHIRGLLQGQEAGVAAR